MNNRRASCSNVTQTNWNEAIDRYPGCPATPEKNAHVGLNRLLRLRTPFFGRLCPGQCSRVDMKLTPVHMLWTALCTFAPCHGFVQPSSLSPLGSMVRLYLNFCSSFAALSVRSRALAATVCLLACWTSACSHTRRSAFIRS